MKKRDFFQSVKFIIVSGVGGFLVSLTGLPIGWMIGTLLTAAFLSIFRPQLLRVSTSQKGIPKYWLYMGQCILGIELGQKMNGTVVHTFHENWLTIIVTLLLSILFSLLSGLFLWRFSKLDMLTSFFATTPGGMSVIPSIAEEVGANTGIVSIIQAIRVFLVIIIIPVVISFFYGHDEHVSNNLVPREVGFEVDQLVMSLFFLLIAWIGYYVGKFLKFPAPWLLGSMMSIAFVKLLSVTLIGTELVAWWPHSFIIISQILIGTSIGSRFNKKMFTGLNKILLISSISTIGLILFVFVSTYFVSIFTDITFLTASLAFAPGGIAEMTTTALVLNGDATFVVAVQVLRIITVCVSLPPLFKFLKFMEVKRKSYSHLSV